MNYLTDRQTGEVESIFFIFNILLRKPNDYNIEMNGNEHSLPPTVTNEAVKASHDENYEIDW